MTANIFLNEDRKQEASKKTGTIDEGRKEGKTIVTPDPAITKCHGTENNVRYSGVFVIAKTPL